MTNIISPKQTAFINSLLSEREVDEDHRALALKASTGLEASMTISYLLAQPRARHSAPAAPAARNSEFAEYIALLKDAVVSKYAIPSRYLRVAFPDLKAGDNDLLFLEVKNYMGKTYLNRLTGAPGDFTRSRFSLEVAVGLLKFIAGRHVEFAKLFADNFHVCGKCAAPLTDSESRATGFGPICRKEFGL